MSYFCNVDLNSEDVSLFITFITYLLDVVFYRKLNTPSFLPSLWHSIVLFTPYYCRSRVTRCLTGKLHSFTFFSYGITQSILELWLFWKHEETNIIIYCVIEGLLSPLLPQYFWKWPTHLKTSKSLTQLTQISTNRHCVVENKGILSRLTLPIITRAVTRSS